MSTRFARPLVLALALGAGAVGAVGAVGARAAAQQAVSPEPYLSGLPPLVDRALLFAPPELTDFQLSPDGRSISFLKLSDGVRTLQVVDREQPLSAARALTPASAGSIARYAWNADARYLVYLPDSAADGSRHIYTVAAGAGAEGPPLARDLTPYGAVRAQLVAVPRDVPDSIVVALNDRDPAVPDAYRIDLATGGRTLLAEGKPGITGWIADRQGRIRLAQRPLPNGLMQLVVVDGDYLAPFARLCGPERGCGLLHFDERGAQAYIVDAPPGEDLSRLYVYQMGPALASLVARDPTKTVDFGTAFFSASTGELTGVYFIADRARVFPLSDVFRRDYAAVRSRVPDGDLYFGSTSANERYHIVRVVSDIEPPATYLYDRVHGRVTLLYRAVPDLPRDAMASMKAVRYRAADGVRINGYLTVPRGVDDRNLPLVVLPHDGPWARDHWGYDPLVQLLANRGYAVFQPNFRGSLGFGDTFQDAGDRQWGTGVMQQDISDGVRWLVGRGIVDPARVAILGQGYGGYAALAGLAFTPRAYAAGVDIGGPSDLIALLRALPPPDTAGPRAVYYQRLGNPDIAADAARLREQSPLFAAGNISAPLLVVQREHGSRVDRAVTDRLVATLRDLGRPVEYLVVPGAGHELADPADRLAVIAAIEPFLARALGGRAQQSMRPETRRRLERMRLPSGMPPAAGAAAGGR